MALFGSSKRDYDNVSGGKAFKGGGTKDLKQTDRTFDQLRKQRVTDKARNRDVHNEQQLARGEIGEMRSPMWVEVGAAILGVFVLVVMWLAWGGIGLLIQTMMNTGSPNDKELLMSLV